jgi:hypothetical protein
VRRATAIVVATLVATVALLGPVSAANADVTTPPGRCVGQASFANGVKGPFTVSSADLQPSDVTTIPMKDTVTWNGSLTGVAEQQREISGFIRIDMPWPIPDITVDSWSGPSSRVQNNGVKDYSLPSVTPRGVEFRVFGEHRENGTVFCTGSAKVKVDGSALGPFSIASLVLFGAGAALAALASRRANPLLGVVAGFLTLLFAGLALMFLGVLALNSPLLTVLPVLGIPLGFAWAKAGVLAAKSAAAV